MSIFYPSLSERVRNDGARRVEASLKEGLAKGKIKKEHFSLRGLAEAFLGHQWYQKLLQYNTDRNLMEATDAVDASAFSNITGQLLVTAVQENYKPAEFIGEELVSEVQAGQNLGTHKVPYIGSVFGEPPVLNQGEQYPNTSFPEQWITLPGVEKRGQKVELTAEMIMADLTGQALERAAELGLTMGRSKEERIMKVIAGVVQNYVFNGTALNTYYASGGSWTNRLNSNVLTDYTSLNSVRQLLINMTDPVSGKPIIVRPNALLVPPALEYNAKRIVSATEVRSGDITTGAGTQTVSGNPVSSEGWRVYSSIYLRSQMVAAGVSAADADRRFFFGDFKKAFGYRVAWPMRVVQAPPQNPADFNQDIVLQVKASEYGVAFVRDPRYVVMSHPESS